MRKKLGKVILALLLITTSKNVSAESACSYSEQVELNTIVANVKATYEETEVYAGQSYALDPLEGEPQLTDDYEKALNINILNVTDDVYIELIDNATGETKTFYNEDTENGIVKFTQNDVSEKHSYTIKVYAYKYDCAGELFRQFDFITPLYNSYSELSICQDYPEFSYCQPFITTDQISFDAFYSNLERYEEQIKEEPQQEEQKKGFFDKIKDFYHKHAVVINTVGTIVVVGGAVILIVYVKKRRSRVL